MMKCFVPIIFVVVCLLAVGCVAGPPTPPLPGPVMIDDLPDANSGCGPEGCGPGGCQLPGPATATANGQKTPLLPWRGGAEARDNTLDARLQALLAAQEAERIARIQGDQQKPQEPLPPQQPIVESPKEPVIEPPAPEPKPWIVFLLIAGALAVGVYVYYVKQKN